MSAAGEGFAAGLAAGVVRYQRCTACGAAQTLPRFACAACGRDALMWHDATGNGVVHALTMVHRAPDDAFRALAPYLLVLVDLDEGVRLMGHGAPGLAIGDEVRATVVACADTNLVRFVCRDEPQTGETN